MWTCMLRAWQPGRGVRVFPATQALAFHGPGIHSAPVTGGGKGEILVNGFDSELAGLGGACELDNTARVENLPIIDIEAARERLNQR